MGLNIGFIEILLLLLGIALFLTGAGFLFGWGFWKAFKLVTEENNADD